MRPKAKRYYSEDDSELGITPSRLKRLGKAKQLEYMRFWFHSNFIDPAEETPYNGREGGYLYVHGGPFDALDELGGEFGELVSQARIEQAVEEVEGDGITEWAPGRWESDDQDERRDMDPDDVDSMEPDLDEIIQNLEAGTTTRYGDKAEIERRKSFSASLEKLSQAFVSAPTHGGIGHNNPPPDPPSVQQDEALSDVLSISNLIVEELKNPDPDALKVARATSLLARVGRWLGSKADLAADEFAKSLGKTLGVGLAGYGIARLPGVHALLTDVVHQSTMWLYHVTQAL